MSAGRTPRRRSKGAARERLIVDAAASAIAERGLAHVTVSDIAGRAGIGVGHVSYYFPTKSVLLMRAITQSEASFHESVVAEIGSIDDPWDRLDRLFELSTAAGPADPGWVLWLEVWAAAAKDPHVAELQAALDARWRAMLTQVIRDGCASGDFTTDDPDSVAMLLSCLVDGMSVHMTLGEGPPGSSDHRELWNRATRAHLRRPG